jgi:hypothetical protein
MELPFRIQSEPGDQPVITVDGSFGAPGLCLSHWPGHSTPAHLLRDLSTQIALAFAELPPEERQALAAGCGAVVNNHYDTDGVCAAFAVLRPEAALPHAKALIAAAAAGDLFRTPSEQAFRLDLVITAFADAKLSPIADELRGLSGPERHQHTTRVLIERLPSLLAPGGLDSYEHLWAAQSAALSADQADLAKAAFDDLVHLDAGVYLAPMDMLSSRESQDPHSFDPGRHAIFGTSELDRVLILGPSARGCTARFLLNTTSWFDMPTRRPQARPDLAALTAALNQAEGTHPSAEICWRHQAQDSPAPELWYGREGAPLYGEHASAYLAPSAQDPLAIKAHVLDALRAAWSFSQADEDDEQGDWRNV